MKTTITLTLPEKFCAALRGLESGTLRHSAVYPNAEGGLLFMEQAIRKALPEKSLLQDWQFSEAARQALPAYREGKRKIKVFINL